MGSQQNSLQSQECMRASEQLEKSERANDVADKLFHARKALRLCPEGADFHASLGDIYLSLGRKKDAQFEYQEALRLDPNNKKAQMSMNSMAATRTY